MSHKQDVEAPVSTATDSLTTQLADSLSFCDELNKPDYRELDLDSPVSPLVTYNTATTTTTTTTTTSTSSCSSASSSVSNKLNSTVAKTPKTSRKDSFSPLPSDMSVTSPTLEDQCTVNNPRKGSSLVRGHRRSASTGSPLIYSSKTLSNNPSRTGNAVGCHPCSLSASSNSTSNSSLHLSGNICPSGKISKPNLGSVNGTRTMTLGSGTGNYGHGSIIRGGTTKGSNSSNINGNSNMGLCDNGTGNNNNGQCESLFKKGMACSDPEEVKKAGNELYRRGSFEEALFLYDRAISMVPDNASYRSNRGAALTALGKLGEAVKECEEAVRLDPGYMRARQRLASLYLRLGQVENARRNLFFPGQSPDPSEFHKFHLVENHFSRCMEARKVGDWKTASQEADGAITAGVDASPQLVACKAEALLKLHWLQDAETSMLNVLKLEKSYPFSSQIKFCSMLAEAYVLHVRSQVEMAMGRFENAVAAAEKAARIDYSNMDIAIMLSNINMVVKARARGNDLFSSGRYLEACSAYGEGLKYDTQNSVLYCNRAVCWSKLGNWEKSIEDCNRALLIQPNYTKALLRRAASNGKLERWADAVRDYEVLQRERPGDTEVAESLHRAQVALKRLAGRKFTT